MTPVSRSNQPDGKFDVIVVGAGASGLMAARDLMDADVDFTVLEARSRVGGRILTVARGPEHAPSAVELGAEFLHGRATKTKQLLRNFGFAWTDLSEDFSGFAHGKLSPLPSYWADLSHVFSTIPITGVPRSFADFILLSKSLSRQEKKEALAFVSGFHAALPEFMSAKAMGEAKGQVCDPEERKLARPHLGYGPLIDWLAAPVESRIQLGCRVNRVRWDAGAVVIDGEQDGEAFRLEARKVLITVPLGVLNAFDSSGLVFEIDPLPPRFRNHLAGIETAHVERLSLEFRPEFILSRFAGGFPFMMSPELHFGTWWASDLPQTPIVTAWAGGEKAMKLLKLSLRDKVRLAEHDLARILHIGTERVAENLVRPFYHDWSADPFARGAYYYPTPGFEHSLQHLAKPVEDTLYFAGEAFDPDHSGTVEGALRSGARAARQMISADEASRAGAA